jgi:hypothetical protein
MHRYLVTRMNLNYAPVLSEELVYELERAAQWNGLPLDRLELLGQDPETAQAFVDHVAQGQADAYLDTVHWQRLEALRESRTNPQPVTQAPTKPAPA